MNNLAIWYDTMVRVCREDEVMSQQELAWASRMSLDAIVTLGAADYMYALMSLGGSDGVTLTMNAVPQTYLAMAFLNGY